LSYSPVFEPKPLALLAMLGVLFAAAAVLFQVDPARIVAAILFGSIVSLLAHGASQRDNDAILSLCHVASNPISVLARQAGLSVDTNHHGLFEPSPRQAMPRCGRWPLLGHHPRNDRCYSMISVRTPEPTVRPPSRMAKCEPTSRATGVISSTVRLA